MVSLNNRAVPFTPGVSKDSNSKSPFLTAFLFSRDSLLQDTVSEESDMKAFCHKRRNHKQRTQAPHTHTHTLYKASR